MLLVWLIRLLGKLLFSIKVVYGAKCDGSFATGWNYFLKYIIATPTNLTAAGLVIRYWRPDLNVAIWITIFGVAIVTINVRSRNHSPHQIQN